MGGSFWDAAMAWSTKRGIDQGMELGILLSAQRMIKNLGVPFEKAMSALEVPQEEWASYLKKMEKSPD